MPLLFAKKYFSEKPKDGLKAVKPRSKVKQYNSWGEGTGLDINGKFWLTVKKVEDSLH